MLYMSDDKKKVFRTEQECYEYEQKINQEKLNKEKLEEEKKSKLDAINKKYDELQELVLNFTKEYGIRQAPYFAPIYELMNMLGF